MDQELGVASVDYRDIKVMIKTPVTTKVFFFCSPGVKQKKWFTAVLNKYEKAGMQPRNIQEMFLCSSVLIHWYCCHNSCIIAYIGRKMLPREAYILSCYCCYKGIVAKRTETRKGWNLPNPFCKPEWARPLLALIVWWRRVPWHVSVASSGTSCLSIGRVEQGLR